MNRFYYGKIGGGKTYLVMFQEIIPALREGRKIVTNVDGIDVAALRNYIGRDVDITVIKSHQWWRQNLWVHHEDRGETEGEYILSPAMHKGAMYVVDECHDIWNAREFKNTHKDFITLLAYNRHFNIDLIFISQNVKMAEVNITRTSNDAYQVKNIGFLGFLFHNKYVVNRRQTPFDTEIISQYKGEYDKSLFSLYKSGANASKIQVGGGFFKSPKMIAFAVFFTIMIVALVRQGNPFGKISPKKERMKIYAQDNGGLTLGGLPSLAGGQVGNKQVSPVSGSPGSSDKVGVKSFDIGSPAPADGVCENQGTASWVSDAGLVHHVDVLDCDKRGVRVVDGYIYSSWPKVSQNENGKASESMIAVPPSPSPAPGTPLASGAAASGDLGKYERKSE
jgi:zona occludens toxin